MGLMMKASMDVPSSPGAWQSSLLKSLLSFIYQASSDAVGDRMGLDDDGGGCLV
jgi:hypothetical protein